MSAPSRDLARLVGAVGDRYVVERELGVGGMATVYLAQDTKHGRQVAIKVLRPELYSPHFAERFLAEIRVTASLQHPHILPLFDSGVADDVLYYVTPYVSGGTLRELMRQTPQLPVAEAVRVASDVASALDYAHRRGIIHRDIKPENILFNDGAALVADFGIAYSASEAAGSERLTATGISIGTPAYMSPEQASGERVVDARSDVYALGAVLYEMLAGMPPHTGASAQAVLAKVLTTDPAALSTLRSDVPDTLAMVVARALARDPAERWESAAALARALQEPQSLPMPQRTREKRRTRMPVALAALVVIALGVTAWVKYWPRESPPPVVTSRRQLTFNGTVENSSLSPDGRFLAYVAHGQDSTVVLMQDLDGGGNPIRLFALPNADVHTLAWSPNGTRLLVAATAGTTPLAYVVAALGGDVRQLPVTTLVRDPMPLAAWLPDGDRIAVWAGNYKEGKITLLSTVTGDTSSLVHPKGIMTSQGSWSHRGDRFAAGIMTDSTSELWLASPNAPPTHLATEKEPVWLRNPVWAPDDRAIFALRSASDLVRIPLGPDGRTTTGEPQVVATALEAWLSLVGVGSALSMTDDGRRVVYTRAVRHANILLLDAAGATRQITTTTTLKFSATLSPDGKQIAFVQRDAKGDNAWSLDLASGTLSQLTFDGSAICGERAMCLAWSPDGAQLALFTRVNGQAKIGVVAANGDGGVRSFADVQVNWGSGIAWAPSTDIVHAEPAAREVRRLAPASGKVTLAYSDSSGTSYNPIVSPDGRQIAFYAISSAVDRSGLWISEVGKAARRISDEAYPIGWTPDGSAIIAGLNASPVLLKISLDGRSEVIGRASARDDLCTPVFATGRPTEFLCTTFSSVSDAWLLELTYR